MGQKFKLAVIDDHSLVRRGIVETLAEDADFEIVALGGTAADAIKAMEEATPDVILIDAMMPGGGIEATRRICDRWPSAKIIVLSVCEDYETVQGALKAGARGYISKSVIAGDLVDAVRKVAGGGSYVSPELAARLLMGAGRAYHSGTADRRELQHGLTLREQQLLHLVGQGHSNQEIALNLGLAENTVKHQMSPLFKKLGVRNRTEAALLAGKLVQAAN